MKNQNVHLFALHAAAVADARAGTLLTIADEQLAHRISRVLRLRTGNQLILFDRTQHVLARLDAIDKKSISMHIEQLEKNKEPEPIITLGLPLLKRRDLETAIYAATEVGVDRIVLLETDKSEHAGHREELLERLKRIVIAAAEQSKNFAYPKTDGPHQLKTWLAHQHQGQHIFFDPDGTPLWDVISSLRRQKTSAITLLVGPEGDLSFSEKELVTQAEFVSCALTPTVLRAHQAVAVGCGAMRALMRSG